MRKTSTKNLKWRSSLGRRGIEIVQVDDSERMGKSFLTKDYNDPEQKPFPDIPTGLAISVARIWACCKSKDRRGTVKRWIPRFKVQIFTGLEIRVIESSHGCRTSERTSLQWSAQAARIQDQVQRPLLVKASPSLNFGKILPFCGKFQV